MGDKGWDIGHVNRAAERRGQPQLPLGAPSSARTRFIPGGPPPSQAVLVNGWFEFTVKMVPVTKARPRVIPTITDIKLEDVGKKVFTRTHTPDSTTHAEQLIAAVARQHGCPFFVRPVLLQVIAYKPDRRLGDVDNYGKLVMDALNELAYADDDDLTDVVFSKRLDAALPRVVVRLRQTPQSVLDNPRVLGDRDLSPESKPDPLEPRSKGSPPTHPIP